MSLLIFLTAVEIALVVGALAYYLMRIGNSLQITAEYLAKVSFGVRAIEQQCAPIGPASTTINGKLEGVAHALESLGAMAGAAADGGRQQS